MPSTTACQLLAEILVWLQNHVSPGPMH